MAGEVSHTIDTSWLTDVSAHDLYSAEVQHIDRLTPEQQAQAIAEAQSGNVEAQHALVAHCLNWTRMKAEAIHQEYQPRHTDVMDLIGHGNLKMLEGLPHALQAKDPVRYLMSTAANEMQRYVYYHDPMIQRSRKTPDALPDTVRLDAGQWPHVQRLAGPDIHLVAETTAMATHQFVYEALARISEHRRKLLASYFGLDGQPAQRQQDIADELGVPKRRVAKGIESAKAMLARRLAPYMLERAINTD
jgi:DNA-directed RNA polymerase specialized sigma subunit